MEPYAPSSGTSAHRKTATPTMNSIRASPRDLAAAGEATKNAVPTYSFIASVEVSATLT